MTITGQSAPVPGVDGWPPHPAEVAPWTVPNRAEKRGYERKRKRMTLAFDGHATLDGLEIVCRNVSLGTAMDMQTLFAEFRRAPEGSNEERAALTSVLEMFGGMVESWNYQVDGIPRSFAWEMLRDEFDYDETMAILNAHATATQGVPAPLQRTSADGPPSVEAQIPMDVPSQSRAS